MKITCPKCGHEFIRERVGMKPGPVKGTPLKVHGKMKEKIVRLFRQGLGIAPIARECQVSRTTVYAVLKEAGETLRNQPEK